MTSGSITGPSGLTEVLSWQVEAVGGERLRVQLRGEINENADFTELGRQLHGDVTLLLDGITRINSCGVREWVNFMRDLRVDSLLFARCAPVVVLQLNAIYNFRGSARVESFLAPYICETCHVDEYKLLDVLEHFPGPEPSAGPDSVRSPEKSLTVPAFRCSRCKGVMTFDELPERYLAFLVEDNK
jgi:hypothetical protein